MHLLPPLSWKNCTESYGKKILFRVIASPTVHVADEILYLSEIVDVIGAVYHALDDPDVIESNAAIGNDGFEVSISIVESENLA
jgi:hypothetical protein